MYTTQADGIVYDADFENSKINPSHRKALESRGLMYEFTAYALEIKNDENYAIGCKFKTSPKQIFTFRVSTYSKSSQLAACVWVHTYKGTLSGSAKTNGYGYSKREAVLTNALKSCGVEFDFEHEGLGHAQLEKLARLIDPLAENILIHQTNI